MSRKAKVPAAKPEVVEPADDRARITERPDGYYWRAENHGTEYGPFPTLAEAAADMRSTEESAYEPGETLEEAEDEIGISGWIDPDTGEPAEESIPRTEDH
ncbi:MAG: hypothetical protein EXR33_07610 [Betaproteobacteria bacterium]|nr:hypothetical protein [Betaproteobacteria bacterium]